MNIGLFSNARMDISCTFEYPLLSVSVKVFSCGSGPVFDSSWNIYVHYLAMRIWMFLALFNIHYYLDYWKFSVVVEVVPCSIPLHVHHTIVKYVMCKVRRQNSRPMKYNIW